MHSSSHRLNHDFHLKYFLAGSCHTSDAAWALLYGQKIDMEAKLKASKYQSIDREIQTLEAQELQKSDDKLTRLRGERILLELDSSDYIFNMNIEGAQQELKTILSLMEELEPLCQYSHLPILERNEACQREEWLLELKRRVENSLLAFGTIPPDQLEAMRQHPDFKTEIVPHIIAMSEKIQTTDKRQVFLTLSSNSDEKCVKSEIVIHP